MFRAPQPKTSRFNKLWKRYQKVDETKIALRELGLKDTLEVE